MTPAAMARLSPKAQRSLAIALAALAALVALSILLGPVLYLHRRYDLGLIELAAGNATAARAQADTILQQQPTHLLGLSLAMRAALPKPVTISCASSRYFPSLRCSLSFSSSARRHSFQLCCSSSPSPR